MTADSTTPTRALARFLRENLASARSFTQELQKEAAQTTVWLVTLASGLLTFSAVNAQFLGSLADNSAKWILGLLMLTVLSGAIGRFLLYLYSQLTGTIVLELETRLAAAALDPSTPPPSVYLHTPQEVVAEIKARFGMDYSFLLELNVPVEDCRKAYDEQLKGWRDNERESAAATLEVFAAYGGKPAGAGAEWLEEREAPLAEIRARAKRLTRFGTVVGTAFLVTIGSFVAALIVLGMAILGRS